MQHPGRVARLTRRARVAALLAATAYLCTATPVAAAPAPLPNWDTAKKQPAPLPDWDAAGKPGKPGKKGKKPKKSGTPVTSETPVETPPAETPPASETPPAETTPEVAAPAPVVEAPPAEPSPAPVEAPDIEPPPERPTSADLEAAARARKVARAEIISGAVFLAGGLGGVAAASAGVFIKNSAEDELAKGAAWPEDRLAPLYDQQKQGETMLAAGAVAGAIGVAIGLALIGAGAHDLKATRTKHLGRVRVSPSFGGLVLTGRF